jgi:hypothetical protein
MRCLSLVLAALLLGPSAGFGRFDPGLLQDDALWAEGALEIARYEVVPRRRGAAGVGAITTRLGALAEDAATLQWTQNSTLWKSEHADPPAVTLRWERGSGRLLDAELDGALLYDELPLRLRQLDWRRATLFEHPLLNGPPGEGFLPRPAAFAVERIREGWRVTIKHGRDTDRLIFDADYPHSLNRWLRRDGYEWRRVELFRE